MIIEVDQKEEETLDAIANGASKATYWIVVATCLAFPMIFLFMFFGEYVGVVYKDQDGVRACQYDLVLIRPCWNIAKKESGKKLNNPTFPKYFYLVSFRYSSEFIKQTDNHGEHRYL